MGSRDTPSYLFPNCRESEERWSACFAFWDEMVHDLAEELGQAGEWTFGWFTWDNAPPKHRGALEFRDCYEAYSERLGRAVQIRQYETAEWPEEAIHVIEKVLDDPDDPNYRTYMWMVSLQITQDTAKRVRRMLSAFMSPNVTEEELGELSWAGSRTAFRTQDLPPEPNGMAPDGSAVRGLLRQAGGSMAHFSLPPGKTSIAVTHRTVEEIWYILDGAGEMWRKQDDREEVIELREGVCLTIPLGTHFQFRATGNAPLAILGVTMPPWPNTDDEAIQVDGPWGPAAS